MGWIRVLALVGLWFMIIALTVITVIAGLSSSSRADCLGSSLTTNTTSGVKIRDSPTCSGREQISAILHHHTSYFQSVHTMALQGALSASLVVFKPALLAMMWTKLRASSTLGALQCNIALANSPSLLSAVFAYVKLSAPFEVVFVLFVATLSIFSPVAISAAYRSHSGPHTVSAGIVVGGGVGPTFAPSLGQDVVPAGIATGRAILNKWTLSNRAISDLTYAPFVPEQSILDIWSAQVETAVARQRLDCGPLAPKRVWSSDNIVTVEPTYFSSDSAYANISFAGQSLGNISNDPQITAVYINASTTILPGGSVETESTVIFLAANGSMEGAQWRINSTTPSSRISYIDVLVCTSTARLEINECYIEQGTFTSCYPSHTPPPKGKNASFGGLDAYVNNPISTSIALSASPALACHQLYTRLPMWNGITEELLASQLPPLSFLTINTGADPYNVPLTYVTNAFFRQTAHALVQGMATMTVAAWQVSKLQRVQVKAVFATSTPALLYVILGVVAVCALMATICSLTARRSTELDAPGLMSRSGELARKLERFVDDTGEMSEDVQKLKVRCVQNRHALILDWEHASEDSVFLKDSN